MGPEPPCGACKRRSKPWAKPIRRSPRWPSITFATRGIATLDRTHREEMAVLYREAQELERRGRALGRMAHGVLEERRALSEIHLLRTILGVARRVSKSRDSARAKFLRAVQHQHRDFSAALAHSALDIQKASGLFREEIRCQYEKLIHNEPEGDAPENDRERRARAASFLPPKRTSAFSTGCASPKAFADPKKTSAIASATTCCARRGSGPVLESTGLWPRRRGRKPRASLASPHRVYRSEAQNAVTLCRAKGRHAKKADLFAYLDALADQSLGRDRQLRGWWSAIDPHRLPRSDRADGERTAVRARSPVVRNAETRNASRFSAPHFYLDPTHTRPVPPRLLGFYMEEAGFGRLEVERLSPGSGTRCPSLVRAWLQRCASNSSAAWTTVIFGRKL